jgi:hypothetical protein
MNKIKYFFIIFIFATIACKKEKKVINDVPPNNIQPCNDVYYKDFNPDTVINVYPNTNLFFNLDLNGDTTNDIHFDLRNYFDNSGPHTIACHLFRIYGLDSTQFVYKDPCTFIQDTSTYITINSPSDSSAILAISYPGECCIPINLKGYIGLKLHQNGKDYCGWLHLSGKFTLGAGGAYIIIDNLAVNNCPNDSINVGHH